jgi:hypothetical protein
VRAGRGRGEVHRSPEWESNPRPTHYEWVQECSPGAAQCHLAGLFQLSCAASVILYRPMSPDFLDEILDAELVTPPIALVAWSSTSKATRGRGRRNGGGSCERDRPTWTPTAGGRVGVRERSRASAGSRLLPPRVIRRVIERVCYRSDRPSTSPEVLGPRSTGGAGISAGV